MSCRYQIHSPMPGEIHGIDGPLKTLGEEIRLSRRGRQGGGARRPHLGPTPWPTGASSAAAAAMVRPVWRAAPASPFPPPPASRWQPLSIPPPATRFGDLMGQDFFDAGAQWRHWFRHGAVTRTWHFGRSTESFGEDPFLAASIVAPEVAAIQAHHVLTTSKHFAAYTQEQNRTRRSAHGRQAGQRRGRQ